jgi:hypothetical protein
MRGVAVGMEVEAVASTVGTVGEATASTVGMVGGATAGEVRGSPSGSGHTGAYMGGRMGGRMDIPMPIPIRIHPRSMSNPHSRYPLSRPRHHLSGTIVTIHRVIIPMSNSVPVAGERWPRAHNRWPEWESLTQPYPIVVEAERLGLFQGFPRQGIALALTRRCPGLPDVAQAYYSRSGTSIGLWSYTGGPLVQEAGWLSTTVPATPAGVLPVVIPKICNSTAPFGTFVRCNRDIWTAGLAGEVRQLLHRQ